MSSDGAKLVRAAAAGDDAKVKRLLKAKVDVDSTVINPIGGVYSCTALQAACNNGHVGTARRGGGALTRRVVSGRPLQD